MIFKRLNMSDDLSNKLIADGRGALFQIVRLNFGKIVECGLSTNNNLI
jgi:hypothetical protein